MLCGPFLLNEIKVFGLADKVGNNIISFTILTGLTKVIQTTKDHFQREVAERAMQAIRDGIGEAVLKLKPEHLGSVSISLKVENGSIKASVQAEMPAVRQWLESQQDTLRSALAEHGLSLDRFDVEPDAQRQQADDEGPRQQSRKRQAQKREAEQPVFEVVV